MRTGRKKLNRSFYTRESVVQIAEELLGMVLCTRIDGIETSGIITETEAYCGRGDRACHARDGRRTERTETMYLSGGHAYVYLCYGIHHLFNVVTNRSGNADAVLIRALRPLDGLQTILTRRNAKALSPKVASGPGRMTSAMGITTLHDKTDLTGDTIWIEDRNCRPNPEEVVKTPRIGIDYAGADAEKPWRFLIEDRQWISRV
ncbi:MAG: DNA-3-methyladenine glycosylase [Balneolaceae bacterium]